MKKEFAVYLYLGVLILGALLAVYLFNVQLTGFAVFMQQTDNFAGGSYMDALYSGSAIILNQTNETNVKSGEYISDVFNANDTSAVWNNLTWIGTIPENTTLAFQVTLCSDATCPATNFVDVNSTDYVINLAGLNLTGQYLKYKVLLSSNSNITTPSLTTVTIGYSVPEAVVSPINVSVSIVDPAGEKTSRTNVPIKFIATGENLQCLYNVRDSTGTEVIGNTTLSGCGNSTFSVSSDGDYIVNLYVTGTSSENVSQSASQSSTFLVNTPATKKSEKENKEEEKVEEEVVTEAVVQKVVDVSIQPIATSEVNPTDSKDFNAVITNIGNVPLTACSLTAGNYADWLSMPTDAQSLNAGESKNFAFTMNVSNGTTEGTYTIVLSAQCAEVIKNSEFSVNVVKKRVDFNITEVERTREDRVVVRYSLKELLDEEQTVELQFFLYDDANKEVGNASVNQTLSARRSSNFRTNIPVNVSYLNVSIVNNLTLSAKLNSEQFSVSVNEPISLGAPTGFFVFGDDMGTTGNVLAIVILIVAGIAVYFFVKRKKISKLGQ